MAIQFSIPQESYAQLSPELRDVFPRNEFKVTKLTSDLVLKLTKGAASGWMTVGVYMAPNSTTGLFNVCGSESEWCARACLGKGKRYGLKKGHSALVARALYWYFHKEAFQEQVLLELRTARGRAKRASLNMAVRLNGTSDIAHESNAEGKFLQRAMRSFPSAIFYDYTKHFGRMSVEYRKHHGISNYHLTFSYSGENVDQCIEVLKRGQNITAVFADHVPETYCGFPVVNGDINDLRFLDPDGVVIGLRQKKSYRVPGVPSSLWVTPEEADPFVITEHLSE